jgi:Uncharacterized conserved protein
MARFITSQKDKPFWKKPLAELNHEQWEALCDGCGKCCLMKFQDADTDEVIFTRVACRLFDIGSCRCTDYDNRTTRVKECVRITPDNLSNVLEWLPASCAYKLRAQKKPLPKWHYLVSNHRQTIHTKRQSVQFFAQPAESVDEQTLEDNLDDYVIYFDI